MFTLHAHSNYSLLQGTIPIESLISFAKKSGSSYVALTDNNSMYGLIKFAKIAQEENIKPILGTYIDDGKYSVVLLAKNFTGYGDLCKIITAKKLKENFSVLSIFNQSLDNLFILTNSLLLLTELVENKTIPTNLYVELIVTEKQKKKKHVNCIILQNQKIYQ
ncbi:MAG: PHP domain-containing protein [bacterium]